jgi:cytoskeleton protein RodZ
MNSVGTELKTARVNQNISLRQVADGTRISFRHLESLEEGNYDRLPGGVYNRAFLRAYGEFLGLDTKSLLELYDLETTPPSKPAKPKILQASEINRGIPPVAVWSIMLLLTVTGLFFGRRVISSLFSSYFSGPSNPQPSPVTSEVAGTGAPSKMLPNTRREADAATPVAPPISPPEPTSSSATAPPVSAPADGRIRVQLQVIDKCWVSVNRDGNRVLAKELEPGDNPSFAADQRFFIILGNAGGVRMTLNGKPAKSLGDSGEVVRLLINEQNLQDFMARR